MINFDVDYYAVLGVLPTSDEVIIKAVYRALQRSGIQTHMWEIALSQSDK